MSRTAEGIRNCLRQFLSILQTIKPLERRGSAVFAGFVLVVWLSAVLFIETKHEFWRDEVRALSLAQEADTPLDLYRIEQFDGHPLVWYLILYAGDAVFHSPLVLPAAAIAIGFGAAFLLLFFAPIPIWWKCLFLFSAIPLYEYSVMARNYGISMLLLFAAAILYPKREKLGLLLALVLALLANTNAHSIIFAGLIAGIWAWDTLGTRKRGFSLRRSLVLGACGVIVVSGILLSAFTVIPRENTILTPIRQSFTLPDLIGAVADSALHPEATLDRILPAWVPTAGAAALFFLAIFGLLFRPPLFLAALFGEIAIGVLFRMVFFGMYRHQALFIIFLLFLYWLHFQRKDADGKLCKRNILFNAGFYIAFTLIVAAGVWDMRDTAWRDLRMEMSSSKALGGFLRASTDYRNAILLPEPDYILESVAYYADNAIYLPRENRFSKTVSWTTESATSLSLAELMDAARDIQNTFKKPVLIILGHFNADFSQPGEIDYSYNKVFTWDAASWVDFQQSTKFIREFNGSLEDENYRVYALREEALPLEGSIFSHAAPLWTDNNAVRPDGIFRGFPFAVPRNTRSKGVGQSG